MLTNKSLCSKCVLPFGAIACKCIRSEAGLTEILKNNLYIILLNIFVKFPVTFRRDVIQGFCEFCISAFCKFPNDLRPSGRVKELYELARSSATVQDENPVSVGAAEAEALAKAYCRNGDFEAAHRLVKQLPLEDLRPQSYGHLLHW